VQREGRLLVDGGLSENLPIDVARAMGVDILIVVDAGYALQPRNKLKSITSISNQALAILVGHDVARQKATLGARDILISPELPDLSSIDFSVVARAVSAGEDAARASSPRLAELALSGAELERYTASRERPAPPAGNIEFVATDPGSRSYHRQIEDMFANLIGKPVNADAIDEDVETLYGRGYLQTLDYRLAQDSNLRQGLTFMAERNTWGPNYLRMGLSLEDDFRGLSTFNAAGRLTMTELNSLGAESVLDLQVGEDPHISAEFYQPLSNVWRFFIAPHAEAESHELPQVENGTQIGLYRISTTEYGVDTGSELGNWGEIRVGALADHGDTRVELGDFTVPPQDFSVDAAFLRFSFDKLDRTYFPHSGESFKIELHLEDNTASTVGTDLLTFDWRSAWTEGKYTQVLWVSGGSTVGGSQTNLRTFFPLGGFLQLSGVPTESLAGPQYAIGRAIFLRSVGNGGEGVLDVPAYAGVSFEAGNVWSSRSQISGDSLRKDASVFFGADTFLGPAYIAVGYDRNGTAAYYLFLGHSF
jgi:NTE family protein